MLYSDGGEVLERVAQRSCGCPIPGSVHGQVGWGFWATWSSGGCFFPWQRGWK